MESSVISLTAAVAETSKPESLARPVREQLEGMILRGELRAGERLNENALATKLNVSRGPVREAARLLSEAGLVTVIHNRGVFVREIKLEEVLHVYDVRAGLAGGAQPSRVAPGLVGRPKLPRVMAGGALEGVVDCPMLRPDGSVISAPGFDAATGLLVVANGVFPEIPERPTQEDARRAAAVLLDLVRDFPFKSHAHRSGWLASVSPLVLRVCGPLTW